MADGLPEWLVPMAATLTQERFTGPDWLFERKFDGIRLLAFKQGPDVRLYSRNRLLQHQPAIAAAIARLPVADAILDGEMTWDGRAYHLFDVMWLDGRDVTALPLEQRRALLQALPLQPPLERVDLVEDAQPWQRAASEGWEGVIAKRRGFALRAPPVAPLAEDEDRGDPGLRGGRVHRSRRAAGWGWGPCWSVTPTAPTWCSPARWAPASTPGCCWTCGHGWTRWRSRTSPFTRAIGLPRGAHWVQPEITVQVAFIEWTTNGKLRHPRLLGVR